VSDTLKLPPLEWLRHREQTCRTCVPDTEPSYAVASAIADKYAECASELTTLRAQVAGLAERVRLLNAECMAWRQGDGDNYRCGCGCDRCVRLRAVRAASDAASAVKGPA